MTSLSSMIFCIRNSDESVEKSEASVSRHWAVQPARVTHQQFFSHGFAHMSQHLIPVGAGINIPLANVLAEFFSPPLNRFSQFGLYGRAFCRRQEFFETLPIGGELFIFALQFAHDGAQHVRGDTTIE